MSWYTRGTGEEVYIMKKIVIVEEEKDGAGGDHLELL